MRQFLLQLWNTYGFYVLYANVNDVSRARGEPADRPRPLGAVAAARRPSTTVRERLDDYDATRAGHAIAAFVDDLSNWYVRRSRRRFWDGDPAAFGTLRTCLVTVAKLLAPFTPVHRRRDLRQPRRRRAERAPVRLPRAPAQRDEALEFDMGVARETVGLGLRRARRSPSSRCASRCAPRWWSPPERERAAIERLADVVRDELNVKEIRYVAQADELGSYEIKPNYRALGPRFGKQMPQVAAAVAALDPAHVAAALRDGAARRRSASTATTTSSAPDDLSLAMKPLEGYQLEREGSHAVALELELDDELRREGLAREIVHAVQNARKAAGPRGRGPDRAARSAATTSCSPPRASTRTTSAARCSRVAVALRRRRRRRRPRTDRGPRAARSRLAPRPSLGA